MKKQLYKLYEKIREVKTWNARIYLKKYKLHQKQNFKTFLSFYFKNYKNLKKENIEKFIHFTWKETCENLEQSFFFSGFSFLRNNLIRGNMFVTAEGKLMSSQLRFLKSEVSKFNLNFLLEEEYVGNPILSNNKYKTSHNTIHNLYHLMFYSKLTKTKLTDIKTIVEWGGGYGNLARIFKKINPYQTYIIIDLPLISCIQGIYLSSIFGKENVNLIDSINGEIKEGKINLLPVCFLEKFKLKADLFISTWALSESSKYSQDYVLKNKWFGAGHILLAINEGNPKYIYPPKLEQFVKDELDITPIKYQEGNFYAFK